MRTELWACGLGLTLASAVFAHEGTPSRFNYHDDVRPIFVEHCGGCHRQGGASPMSLLEYSEAVPWANSMKMQVLEQRMPPWLPAEGIGTFLHARSLSAKEIDILVDWASGLTPEGEPLTADDDPSTDHGGWSLGEPDLVLSPDAVTKVEKDEVEATRCIVLPTGLEKPRLASAFELRPGLPTIVRRATLYLGTSCGPESRPLVTWLSGEGAAQLAADGDGALLAPGASLAVEILYVKGWNEEGRALEDRSALGLWWKDGGRRIESLHVTGPRHVFFREVTLVAIYPDPQEVEEPLRVEAVSPDGVVRPLLVIERYYERWRERYVLAEPLALPAGTELELSQAAAWFDFVPAAPSTAQ